ncbi:MAG: S9 family peptidase [candidate division Zixibacteria bacterium HGW-Zixibacteria-1]|nr:MAG: S9 family peptidase [candidate division Zixibacteria bacterium HGW-Zixibacteria-1]
MFIIARKSPHFYLAVILFGLFAAVVYGEQSFPPPPVTDTNIAVDTLHGVVIEDPYRWLEDINSPETREWIKAQNEYTQSIVESLPYREEISKRLAELIKTDYVSTPHEKNNRFFMYKRAADQDQYSLFMRDGLNGEDRLLVDPAVIDPDLLSSISIVDFSNDGEILAYGIRRGGKDETSVKLLNVNTGAELPDSFPEAVYFGFSMTADEQGIFYSPREEDGSHIYYHKMGTDLTEDRAVFGEQFDPESGVGCQVSPNGKYLIITVFHGSAGNNEYFYRDLTGSEEIKPLTQGIAAYFEDRMADDIMLLKTNWEAPNGRIIAIDLRNPARENWREIIPQAESVIEEFSAAGGKIFVNYLENVVSKVKIFDINGKGLGEISFPALGSVSSIYGNWESNHAFFNFSSYHIPATIYHLDIQTGEQTVWFRRNNPVNSDNFEVKQVWYTSKDGTKIPMFLVYRKGIKLNGMNPTLLYGYGGFRANATPSLNYQAIVFAENGGVYAEPAIRGGGEFGEEWHEAAMLDKKQNSFDDFIAAAEWLINNGYTNRDKLAIKGGSNGGLLVGAVMNQRPDLCRVVICTYPLLDMLRYDKFLMGKYWVSEYGTADSSGQFDFIYKYSPYHNVDEKSKYPSVMFITGDSDTRVAPLHARKMTALLQAKKGAESPILLLYDTKMGHSGGQPVSKWVKESTDEDSFLYWQLGM